MSAVGIIFSNIHDKNLPELTRIRTMASVPFACRYRLVDFTLSNMVNSNIYDINVIANYNYHSLMDHIGSGKDWDLARRSGGVKILPPFITAYANNSTSQYSTRLEALKGVGHFINNLKADYVVMSDCDVICNIDYNEIIKAHIETGADMTFVVKTMDLTPETSKNNVIYDSDECGRVTDVRAYSNFTGKADVSLNIVIANRQYLQMTVLDAIAHNYVSMNRDIISHNLMSANYRVYKYNGYYASVNSMEEYFAMNMEVIGNSAVRNALFNVKNRPIYTKIRNSPPAYYSDDSNVRGSLIADGCKIEGTVENSILFRGVTVGKNAVVKNSILYQDTIVGKNVHLNCVISDKNVVLRDGVHLSGNEALPFYISKGKMI